MCVYIYIYIYINISVCVYCEVRSRPSSDSLQIGSELAVSCRTIHAQQAHSGKEAMLLPISLLSLSLLRFLDSNIQGYILWT